MPGSLGREHKGEGEKCIAHHPLRTPRNVPKLPSFLRKLRCCLCVLLSPLDTSLLAITVTEGDTFLPQSSPGQSQRQVRDTLILKEIPDRGCGCWQPERTWDPKKRSSTLDQSTPFSLIF